MHMKVHKQQIKRNQRNDGIHSQFYFGGNIVLITKCFYHFSPEMYLLLTAHLSARMYTTLKCPCWSRIGFRRILWFVKMSSIFSIACNLRTWRCMEKLRQCLRFFCELIVWTLGKIRISPQILRKRKSPRILKRTETREKPPGPGQQGNPSFSVIVLVCIMSIPKKEKKGNEIANWNFTYILFSR